MCSSWCSLSFFASALGLVGARPASGHAELVVMDRVGYVYRPKATSSPSGAVFVLHGSEATPQSMFDLGFESFADTRNFLVVYPEMLVPKDEEWGYASDIPYFAALAKRLQEPDFSVPANKLFICGHSAGGTLATFLQNQMDEFAAAGVVEAAVGHMDSWTMSRRGKPTLVVWNHADPVLKEFAPNEDEMAYLNLTIDTLRRRSSTTPDTEQPLPTGATVTSAKMLVFNEDTHAPKLQIVSFTSEPGKHDWPHPSWTSCLDATRHLIDFFFPIEADLVV
eukprot:TRINITY_DN9120_c0_g2_i2.p1 TRINITY_DN9120_c0_g2~~TRINITY_DN9120_c0_g2_i2.p1  ORF type:complete len:279 (+),score=46.04 TRINITY_DN9120_c0_g2_i2:68-904(+)